MKSTEINIKSEFEFSSAFALEMDRSDKLFSFRDKFYFPVINGKKALYFTGNSLGLQPKKVRDYVNQELEDWAHFGVEGHFKARRPWFSYHEQLTEKIAKITGAKNSEVVVMNQLSVNIHLLMVSFYKPTSDRYKIICEKKAFPSDQYILETQVKHHGLNPDEVIVEVGPREGEEIIRHEDIISAIEKCGTSLALVMIGGVNYFTGQVFDMENITRKADSVGAIAGFDLAHAAGNIKLELHKWNVDFSSWCGYKYLNSGPGSVAGVFIHERHSGNTEANRFGGWWGHEKETRFKMEKGFKPIPTAEGWQLSNAPVLSMAAHLAALEIFEEAGMDTLIEKSKKLTAWLEFVISYVNRHLPDENKLSVITPEERGCQLSIVAKGQGRELFSKLEENGVVVDWREPNVIRLAPVPLYNSYTDVFQLGEILLQILRK